VKMVVDWKKILVASCLVLIHFLSGWGLAYFVGGSTFGAIFLGVNVCTFLVLSVWGDRLVLGLTRSKKLIGSNDIISRVSNKSFLLGLTDVKLYRTNLLPGAVLCVQTIMGPPVLIMGEDYFIRRKDFDVVLEESMNLFLSKESMASTIVSLAFFLWTLPPTLIWGIVRRHMKIVAYFMEQMTLPFFLFLHRLLKPKKTLGLDRRSIGLSLDTLGGGAGSLSFWTYNCIMFLVVTSTHDKDFLELSTQN